MGPGLRGASAHRSLPTCANLDKRNLWLHNGTTLTRLASKKKVCHIEVRC